MPVETGTDVKGDAMEELRNFHISSLEDEGDEQDEEVDGVNNGDDDDDDNDDDDEHESVTLGFVEKPKNPRFLLRHFFPSKAGGLPAWLDPINLPAKGSSLCDFCGQPLQFLLQVYAPISENESAFHRTLFVFMCPSMTCLLRDQHEQWKRPPEKASRSVKVFRCQLPRSNPFYSNEHPRYDGTDKPSGAGAQLCSWCGTWKGDKVCSSCRGARYCSEEHQVMHWRSGHKTNCQHPGISSVPSSINHSTDGFSSADVHKVASKTSWPEHEIINEDEADYDTEGSKDYENAKSLVTGNRVDETFSSLLNSFEGDGDRKSWATFQERICKAPGQVLRYNRDAKAKPLWPMASGRPCKADISKCSHCGANRGFELQILPQLLYYFEVKNDPDSLDWATIAVYTCAASCHGSLGGYKEEFAWVQLSSPSVIVP